MNTWLFIDCAPNAQQILQYVWATIWQPRDRPPKSNFILRYNVLRYATLKHDVLSTRLTHLGKRTFDTCIVKNHFIVEVIHRHRISVDMRKHSTWEKKELITRKPSDQFPRQFSSLYKLCNKTRPRLRRTKISQRAYANFQSLKIQNMN